MSDTNTVKCSECGILFVQEYGCPCCLRASTTGQAVTADPAADALLPCPFCGGGGSNTAIRNESDVTTRGGWYARHCGECGARGMQRYGRDSRIADEGWNCRNDEACREEAAAKPGPVGHPQDAIGYALTCAEKERDGAVARVSELDKQCRLREAALDQLQARAEKAEAALKTQANGMIDTINSFVRPDIHEMVRRRLAAAEKQIADDEWIRESLDDAQKKLAAAEKELADQKVKTFEAWQESHKHEARLIGAYDVLAIADEREVLCKERDRYRQALRDIEAERQNLHDRIDDSQVAHWMCDAASAALGAPGGEGAG